MVSEIRPFGIKNRSTQLAFHDMEIFLSKWLPNNKIKGKFNFNFQVHKGKKKKNNKSS